MRRVRSEEGDETVAAAAAHFGLELVERAAPPFGLWRGNVRAAAIWSGLPSGVHRFQIPPMGGKMIFAGLDWGAVAALVESQFPGKSGRWRRGVYALLAALESEAFRLASGGR